MSWVQKESLLRKSDRFLKRAFRCRSVLVTVGRFCSVCGRLVHSLASASTARSEAALFPGHLTPLTRQKKPARTIRPPVLA